MKKMWIPRIPRCFFLGIGSKTKTENWRKVFYNMFYLKLDFPNFKQRYQRSSKVAYVYMVAFIAWLGLVSVWKKEAAIPI